MSQQLRVLVVEDDEHLKQSIVSSLQKDGYSIQGVSTGAEAIRILWANEQNLVIGDKQLPDADGLDLLQWIRAYSPRTRMIMLAAAGSPGARTQALENGAVGYLEKPIDMRLLKVEVRRLLQQTGFTASLASFDLLDVIQIINMSRKSIALVVHTGLEEQGLLGFQSGELIWAEYGILRGEEAFFALAAHKNGTVTQQPWNDQIAPNVRQPLARLIMQALHYRSKYAQAQQLSGEYEAINARLAVPGSNVPPAQNTEPPIDMLLADVPDDRPFTYVAESPVNAGLEIPAQPMTAEAREWWQESAKLQGMERSGKMRTITDNTRPAPSNIHKTPFGAKGTSITPSTVRKTPAGQRPDLPSWLMDQPTQFEVQALRPSSLTGSGRVPAAPGGRPTPAEWHPAQPVSPAPSTSSMVSAPAAPANGHTAQPSNGALPRSAPAEWQTPLENVASNVAPVVDKSSSVLASHPANNAAAPGREVRGTSAEHADRAQGSMLQSLSIPRQTDDLFAHHMREVSDAPATNNAVTTTRISSDRYAEFTTQQEHTRGAKSQPRPSKRNYPALVSALQTVGYSLPGFIASAVVGIDGQPIAQVAVEDMDISPLCGDFSALARGALLILKQGDWGKHEDTIITSATHHIVLRVLGGEKETFQVVITTRESDPVESLEVMANVEGAILSAL